MREALREIRGQRAVFRATFVRFGERSYKSHVKRTALFRSITDANGREVADHLWFTVGVQLDRLQLEPGDVIEFAGRSTAYRKGYRGRREDYDLPPPSIDYRLSRPTHVRLLDRACTVLQGQQTALVLE